MSPSHIAIIGGGLTGLSSAFYLSRRFPNALITLLEKERRLGGWVRSERLKIHNNDGVEGTVILEAGPRTLRPNAKSTLELINLLGLESSLVTVPKNSPAAKLRYICDADFPGLQSIPSSLSALYRTPLGRTIVSDFVQEAFRRSNSHGYATDESVYALVSRRYGEEFARLLISSLGHGVYAADSRKLSVRATFPMIWKLHERGGGNIFRGLVRSWRGRPSKTDEDAYELGSVPDVMKDVSVYTFKDGISTLTDALARELRNNVNVRIYGGVRVTSLRMNLLSKGFEVNIASNETLRPTHVVSTAPLPQLALLLSPANRLPHLTANTSSSVTVVNLIFRNPSPGHFWHPPGFGYLVPRPRTDYSSESAGILGVVFDSAVNEEQYSAQGLTSITAMLGGPYPITSKHVEISTILRHISEHLGINPAGLPDPLIVRVHHNIDCIPIYGVGHVERMDELKSVLQQTPWDGRMEVIGAGVGGVSVGDCVEAGRKAGLNWS